MVFFKMRKNQQVFTCEMLLSSSWRKANTFDLGFFIEEVKLNGYVCLVFFYEEEGPAVAVPK